MDLFGKNVEDRFIPMFTFSDGSTPLAIQAVKENGIKFLNWFKFNNEAVWSCNNNDLMRNYARL